MLQALQYGRHVNPQRLSLRRLQCLRSCTPEKRKLVQPGAWARSQSSASQLVNNETTSPRPRIRFQTTETDTRLKKEEWPRMPKLENAMDIRNFRQKYYQIAPEASIPEEEVTIRGRIWSIRKSGNKLAFVDLTQDGARLQCIFNRSKMEHVADSHTLNSVWESFHRGDVLSVKGYPHRTSRQELSVIATGQPVHLSTCQHTLPERIENQETKMQNRYVDFLIDQTTTDILKLRSAILQTIRKFLELEGFMEVQTPILADTAGGAVAKPFQTSATEFQDRKLSLRIAPELWLKKLIVGGFERIYEIGPSFRNEGIDLHHNPEFWTCEFYQTYTDLDRLIHMTENLFHLLAENALALKFNTLPSLKGPDVKFHPPFPQVDFIPALEKGMGVELPQLDDENAQDFLKHLLIKSGIRLPSPPTLPRMLDKLAARFLEPRCVSPTWIINHPECLSPLSKSFVHPENGQRVAARAELFVKRREIVNTYEEENSPIEQRRKFEMQLRFKDPDAPTDEVDESFLEALSFGMPPTGGWGCGIERLIMLFSGTNRIADTLSFGTLRNVVSNSGKSSLTSPLKSAMVDGSSDEFNESLSAG